MIFHTKFALIACVLFLAIFRLCMGSEEQTIVSRILELLMDRSTDVEDETIRPYQQVSGSIDVCFVCCNRCQKYLTDRGYNDSTYFDAVTSEASEVYRYNGVGIEVTNRAVYGSDKDLWLTWLISADIKQEGERLIAATDKFWTELLPYPEFKSTHNCDVGFLATVPNDPEWNTMSGLTKQGAMCGDHGYGLLKMDINVVDMGVLLAHELGHNMGLTHDELNPNSYQQYVDHVPLSDRDMMEGTLRHMKEDCFPDSGSKPCAGEMCLMSEIATSSDYRRMSACSLAQLDYWLTVPTSTYDRTCVIET